MSDEMKAAKEAAWAAEKALWEAAKAAKAAWAAVDAARAAAVAVEAADAAIGQAKNTFHPDYNTEAVLVEEMQRMAAELEAANEWVKKLEKIIADQDAILMRRRCVGSAEHLAAHITYGKGYQEGRQDAEDAHKEFVEPMTEVAERFAHRIALELECVLSDGAYSNKWYKSAMQVLSEYRSAMNAIHEQHSPTFMGEPKI